MASASVYENEESDIDTSKMEEKVQEPEWILAKQGINLLINNSHTEAELLFLQYPNSLVMYAGYSIAVFMDALMSFEEEKLSKAILVLKEVEKRCTTQTGWLKSISQKVFGSGNEHPQSLAEQLETQIILADSQVCLAILTFLQQDLSGYFKGGWVLRKAWKVYQRTYKEILTLYKDNIGELQLPDPITTPLSASASMFDEPATDPSDDADDPLPPDWDVPEPQFNGYSHTSKSKISHSRSLNFTQNYTTTNNHLAEPDDFSISTRKSINNNTKKAMKRPSTLSFKKSTSVAGSLSRAKSHSRGSTAGSARFNISALTTSLTNTLSLSNLTSSLRDMFPGSSYAESQVIDKKTIVRLMEAISFGYGLFQLGVSLLPPSLTRLISLLGFAANRTNGIACLMYARLGIDMRAPLASLALLWYHTIVRPFYAIDGINVQAGVEAATVLIQESRKEFDKSALFLFFGGRTYRLNSEISTALTSFQKANDNANHREIKMLCLHEIGWCHLIELDYQNARTTFNYLKHASRWSRSFYGYLAAICIGATPDFSNYSIFDELQKNTGSTRGGQLDEFLTRRLHCCPKDSESAKSYVSVYFKMLVFEMLYLWNALASCSKENISQIVADCTNVNVPNYEPRRGLANLILGSCYSIQTDFKQATECFRKCLDHRRDELSNAEDAHISAFAQYELGNILVQNQETKEEGKYLLQQINRYDHYDFEARLNVRIHSILRHLD